MKTAELVEPEKPALTGHKIVQLPYGLLGFERVKNYLLVANAEEEPFFWMQMMDAPKKAFLVVSPFLVLPDYRPDIPAADVELLEIRQPSDALLFNICTLRPNQPPTLNLKGPIVINRHTLIGKQSIPDNAALYSLRHPLAVS